MSDAVLLEPPEARQVAGSADLVPALVLKPAGGGVGGGVLQPHSARQEEHEVGVRDLLRSAAEDEGEAVGPSAAK